jgi:hypothetical protein
MKIVVQGTVPQPETVTGLLNLTPGVWEYKSSNGLDRLMVVTNSTQFGVKSGPFYNGCFFIAFDAPLAILTPRDDPTVDWENKVFTKSTRSFTVSN